MVRFHLYWRTPEFIPGKIGEISNIRLAEGFVQVGIRTKHFSRAPDYGLADERTPGERELVNLSDTELTNALRRRRTVSVCSVLKSAKRGRFAYFALKLTLMGRAPYNELEINEIHVLQYRTKKREGLEGSQTDAPCPFKRRA